MEPDNQKEEDRINYFISLVSPIVTSFVKKLIQGAGLQVKQEDSGLKTVLSVKKGNKEAKMYLRNLLLEIATLDRDQKPLRFDPGLEDFGYFAAKTSRLAAGKLKVLFHLLKEDDVKVAVDKIKLAADQYERIRILQFDRN